MKLTQKQQLTKTVGWNVATNTIINSSLLQYDNQLASQLSPKHVPAAGSMLHQNLQCKLATRQVQAIIQAK